MTIDLEEFLETASADQKKLLLDLQDLAEKERELSEKINKIFKSVNVGVYSNNAGITLCEDIDDIAAISAGPREELRIIKNQIAYLLKKAVEELEMGDVGIIQRQYKNYVRNA